MKKKISEMFARTSGAIVLAADHHPYAGDAGAQTLVTVNDTADAGLNSFYHSTSQGSIAYAIGNPYTFMFCNGLYGGFDLSSIPSNATILSATLNLPFSGNNDANVATMNLYQATTPWTSAATWDTTNGSTPWTTGGGDYNPTPVSSLTSTFQGSNTSRVDFPFTGLASVVQGWLNSPSTNDGFVLINTTPASDALYKQSWGLGGTAYVTSTYPPGYDTTTQLVISYEVVPEPSSVALILGGMAGLLALTSFRRRRAL